MVHSEHVLRPSASASASLIRATSSRSLRPPTVPATAPTALHKRPSPSPSIKRGKAEKLLKEHGSPPGMRVTAGGRVVPSDLTTLGTSRFGDNTYKPQALRVAPGNVMSSEPQSNNNSTARIEIVNDQPVVFIGNQMFALPAVHSNTSTSPPGDTAVVDTIAKQTLDPAMLSSHGGLHGMPYGSQRPNTHTPFAGLDLPTLKAQQNLKRQELRTVEQTEVLQASHQSEAWRAGMIEKKRCLITELDGLRKQITALESDSTASAHPTAFQAPFGAVAGPVHMPPFVPQIQQPVPQPMYTLPTANPYASMMMYQHPFGTFSGFSTAEPPPFVPATVVTPHSPGEASRRSHAIEIKPPREDIMKRTASTLDPKSPTYEPSTNARSTTGGNPPTPSPAKRSSWRNQEAPQSDKHEHRALSQKPSLSSIDTQDFFPMNTHEYSSTRVAPKFDKPKESSNDKPAVPSTPEKGWPAGPWNEGNSGRSKNNEPVSRLTSWPEAFGKQSSHSSLRQEPLDHPSLSMQERPPTMGAGTSSSASSSNVLTQKVSDQRSGTDNTSPFADKAVAHAPSTYQEGYQAGYDHIGIPDIPEVLQGYIQGLLHFLSDETKRIRDESAVRGMQLHGIDSRTPSIRGLVTSSTPHDSAVSMTFGRSNTPNGSQENAHSAKINMANEIRRDSAYSPQGSIRNAPVGYALGNETGQKPGQRKASGAKYLNLAGPFSDRMTSGYRPNTVPNTEAEICRTKQDKGMLSRADTIASSGGFGRQVSGNQLNVRPNGTALSMQRFYPATKETGQGGFGGESVMRPFVNHRVSGLDGAMDDVAEIIMDTHKDEWRNSRGNRFDEAPMAVESEEVGASCFKPSGAKDKQKASSSPAKGSGAGREGMTCSPAHGSSSPKKGGEHSPAKAKLEQVTNKFRRVKKDDPRTMSPEDKKARSQKWRERFQTIRKTEIEEIEEYHKNNFRH